MAHSKVTHNLKGLAIASGITAIIMLFEFFGGLATNSLALLSDSGHMLSDVSSLVFSFLAIYLAKKPPTMEKPYGFHRLEILAALFNGITLFVIASFIIAEAYKRLVLPPAVNSGYMMFIATIGMIANILSAWALVRQGDVKNNINMRSAYLHIIGDTLGSVGAIFAGLIMYYENWYIADPIISIIVALVILKGAGSVIKQALHILMEGTPSTIDIMEFKKILENIDGVINVHDLRIWSLTSEVNSLCCHLVVNDRQNSQDILQQAISSVKDNYNIKYTTIQVEKQYNHQRIACQ
jgi:cobalt-zinc-cadmium efflux system protein